MKKSVVAVVAAVAVTAAAPNALATQMGVIRGTSLHGTDAWASKPQCDVRTPHIPDRGTYRVFICAQYTARSRHDVLEYTRLRLNGTVTVLHRKRDGSWEPFRARQANINLDALIYHHQQVAYSGCGYGPDNRCPVHEFFTYAGRRFVQPSGECFVRNLGGAATFDVRLFHRWVFRQDSPGMGYDELVRTCSR